MSLARVLKASSLSEEQTDPGAARLFDERTEGMWPAAWEKCGNSITRLDEAVRIYGMSCYLQGARDAAEAAAISATVTPPEGA